MAAGRHKSSGWGLVERRANPPGWLLFNFDVDSAHLKAEHREALHAQIVPLLKWGYGVTVVGLASRTGSERHNEHLSWQRCQRTLDYLKTELREAFPTRPAIGFGEMKAKTEGQRDNVEDPRYRSVVILVGPKGVTPLPPRLVDVSPLVPESVGRDDDLIDAEKVNDVLGGISNFLELVPIEKVATFAENFSFWQTLFQGVVQMPLLWAEVRKQNDLNGTMQGYWEAMQDMADTYANPNLSSLPLEKWPPLTPPRVRPFPPGSGNGMNEQEWMAGKRKGCQAAYEVVMLMERLRPVKANWEITGRRYLFLLSQKYGTNVEADIKSTFDKRLRDANGYGFPLRK